MLFTYSKDKLFVLKCFGGHGGFTMDGQGIGGASTGAWSHGRINTSINDYLADRLSYAQ